jgi:hypothetical protein
MLPTHQITATVANFCQMTDLGRSLVYEMIADGRLQTVRAGKRRILIVLESWRREIERQAKEGVPDYLPVKAAQEARRRRIDIGELDL